MQQHLPTRTAQLRALTRQQQAQQQVQPRQQQASVRQQALHVVLGQELPLWLLPLLCGSGGKAPSAGVLLHTTRLGAVMPIAQLEAVTAAVAGQPLCQAVLCPMHARGGAGSSQGPPNRFDLSIA